MQISKNIGSWLGLIALLLLCEGCIYGYTFDPEDSVNIEIRESTLDNAFSKALFVLSEAGYSVNGNRNAGTLNAYVARGGGFGTTTTMTGLLTDLDDGTLRLNLKVKSSRGSTEVVEEFLSAYRQYVDARILP
jgi:hypothetical protein